MAAIPASQIVNVNPGVIGAGGTGLDLSGLLLTNSTQLPIGSVLSLSSYAAVVDYFGGSSVEAAEAAVYFDGFNNSSIKPGAMLFAQYPTNTRGVAPWLRSADLSSMTLAELQAVASGTLSVTINGVAKTSGTINLSAVASFSAAATAIQTALAAYDGVVTASIATTTTLSVTASISGYILTVGTLGAGSVQNGAILAGTGVTAGTMVQKQLTGTANGVGTYQVSISQDVTTTTITGSYGTMTVSGVASGALAVGQTVSGSGVTAGTVITALLTGTGGTGTYVVSPSQTASSTTVSAGPALVTYDSVSGAFVITGGTPGTGTIGYGSGSIATSLSFTQALGATTSQGAPEGVPATNMAAIIGQSQNWASFTTSWEPLTADKILFAAWTDAQNDRYLYVMWDTDVTVTTTSDTASAGYAITAAEYGGTAPIYSPTEQYLAAFGMGVVASIDYAEKDGRLTLAFKSQSGIAASVTDATVADNLIANGYNFYGAYGTANEEFTFFNKGVVSGEWLWIDSYVNQIWLNNAFQLDLMDLMTTVRSIPYNASGYAMLETALSDTIQQALFNGVIRTGVILSASQRASVTASAGQDITSVLETRGWYLLIRPARAEVRAARGSPPCTFFYTDGQSIQAITLSSLEIQ